MGRSGPSDFVNTSPRDPAALTKHLNKSALHLVTAASPGQSYFGGLPPMYNGFHWPEKGRLALSFLACIDLSEVPREVGLDWLPPTGRLLFFYDEREMPWGFDPKDRGGWKVIYLPDSTVVRGEARIPKGLDEDWLRKKRPLEFRALELPPSWENPEIEALKLNDVESDAFCDYRDSLFVGLPKHQMGGFPDPIQGPDMDLECQLASNGLYCGDSTGYNDPRAKELEKGRSDWQLLFQMDTDDDLEIMWGDGGMIYFWIRRQDALERNFDEVWLILQCH